MAWLVMSVMGYFVARSRLSGLALASACLGVGLLAALAGAVVSTMLGTDASNAINGGLVNAILFPPATALLVWIFRRSAQRLSGRRDHELNVPSASDHGGATSHQVAAESSDIDWRTFERPSVHRRAPK